MNGVFQNVYLVVGLCEEKRAGLFCNIHHYAEFMDSRVHLWLPSDDPKQY